MVYRTPTIIFKITTVTESEFTAAYNRLYPKVYRLCLGYVAGDHDSAADLCQQTFIKVWNYRNSFNQKAALSTWIYRIAVNSCLGHNKKKRPQALVNTEVEMEETEAAPTDYHNSIKHLYLCIDTLKPINKTVILLELEEIPQQEIADSLGYSHGSIRTRLHRIRELLLKCLNHGK